MAYFISQLIRSLFLLIFFYVRLALKAMYGHKVYKED